MSHLEGGTLTTIPVPAHEEPIAAQWRTPIAAWLVLAVLFAVVYLGSTYTPALMDDADSTHAEAAREMVARGDYVTLHVNGVRYLEKAPLIYWLVAAGYHLFGIGEFATRLPNAFAVLGCGLLLIAWARRAFGDRAGLYAGLAVFTSIGFYLFTRILIPEAMLSFLIGAALYSFLTGLEPGARKWRWYLGYACVGAAVLAKGLVALVFVGIPAVTYIAITGEWRRWREFRLFSGFALIIAIAAPWHILAGLRNRGFFWFYFINEHVLRFLGRRYPKDYNSIPQPAYWLMHLAWLFPWSLYLALAFRRLRRDLAAVGRQPRTLAERTRLLCWIWAGVVLLFFALGTSQEYYTFPAYLPLLLLTVSAMAEEEDSRPGSRWLSVPNWIYAAIGVLTGGILIAGLWASRSLPYSSDIGSLMAERGVGNYTLSMSHFFDLTTASFAALRLPAGLAAVAFIVGPLAALVLRLRRKPLASTWAMAIGAGLFLVAAHVALVRFEPFLSSKPLAQAVAPQLQPTDRLMIYGDQAFGSSLLFYLRRPISLVNGRTTSMWFGSQFPDAPRIFLSEDDLRREWTDDTRVFLFVPEDRRDEVEKLLREFVVVAESSGKAIYSNRR